ncbi:hypothetical protein GLOIN_2v1783331 [Rhizophagus irregularis DAOM 181602=DAOM 197198]|nr:hypothetical protein GLOIN_2v1783331 [Rhizophagus irregularis DAOM 181602=DAOM 197198]
MTDLNNDVLNLIFEQLQDDKNTFYPCLLVNKNCISRNQIREHESLTNSYQRPSFNYISFCRHLNLNEIHRIINELYNKSFLTKHVNQLRNWRFLLKKKDIIIVKLLN